MNKLGHRIGRFGASLVFSLIATASLRADTVVSSTAEADLRAAIAAGGTITFSVDGTFTLTSPIVISNNTTIDATGRDIVIDGAGATRLFQVEPNVTANFLSLKLFNGKDSPPQSPPVHFGTDALGGALLNRTGIVAMVNCTLSNNVALGGLVLWDISFNRNGASLGGAIHSQGGSVALTNCILIKNRAEGRGPSTSTSSESGGHAFGGAISLNGGALTMESCTLHENSAKGGSANRSHMGGVGFGGGIFLTNQAMARIIHTQIRSNLTGGGWYYFGGAGIAQGGGIWSAGTLTLQQSALIGNSSTGHTAKAEGGGLFNKGSLAAESVSFANNLARGGESAIVMGNPQSAYEGLGGGLFNGGSAALTNVTFLANNALGGGSSPFFMNQPPIPIHTGHGLGGGIYSTNQLTLAYCTLASNRAIAGPLPTFPGAPVVAGDSKADDIYNTGGSVGAHASIFGSISVGAAFGSITDGGYNIAADNSAAFTNATSLNSTDPKFGPATDTYIPLGPGSPAINSGSPNFPPTDQLGTTRPQGPAPDRGAIEFDSFWIEGLTVTSPEKVTLQVVNLSGAGFIIQGSTNLNFWTEVARTDSTTSQPHQFSLPSSGDVNFWRVISQ